MGWDSEIDDAGGRRTVYVRDPNGHSYEFFTAVPD
jgi:catechol 2,3-dioxygenase-like lactoylglutathione lyase family enzyme